MNAEILCVGTELLLGDIVNTNAVYIAKELAKLGIDLYHQSVVGDNPYRLTESIKVAFSRADILIMTGGLGPTYDDLTKETVAKYFGLPMELHQRSLERIEAFFRKVNRPMTDNNKKQAMMPQDAIVFDNANGTAPGLAVEGHGKVAILLPGPPREMEPMFSQQVVPYLRSKSEWQLVSHSVHLFGIGESNVENILRDMMVSSTNPTIAPYAKDGEVLLRVTARARSQEEAEALIAPAIQRIRTILGEYIYGVDSQSLQQAAVELLLRKGVKVATAESCTGGYLSKRITEIPGASQVFEYGVCTYANRIKEEVLGVSSQTLEQYGAVSKKTAVEMARGVRRVSGAEIGVSVTGIAGPDGGTPEKPVGLVYVAVDSELYGEVLELKLARGYHNDRELIRYVAASHALNLVIKAAKQLPDRR